MTSVIEVTHHRADLDPSSMFIAENVLILQSNIFAAQPCLPKALDNPHPKALEAIHEEEAILSDQSVFLRACFAGNHEQLDLAAARLGKAVARFFDNERP